MVLLAGIIAAPILTQCIFCPLFIVKTCLHVLICQLAHLFSNATAFNLELGGAALAASNVCPDDNAKNTDVTNKYFIAASLFICRGLLGLGFGPQRAHHKKPIKYNFFCVPMFAHGERGDDRDGPPRSLRRFSHPAPARLLWRCLAAIRVREAAPWSDAASLGISCAVRLRHRSQLIEKK